MGPPDTLWRQTDEHSYGELVYAVVWEGVRDRMVHALWTEAD